MRSLLDALPAGAAHVVCAHPDLYPPGTHFDPAMVPPHVAATRVRTRSPIQVEGRPLPNHLAYVLGTVLAACRLVRAGKVGREPFSCVMGVYPDRFGLMAAFFVSLLTRLPLVAYMHDYLSEGLHDIHPVRVWWWRRVEQAVFGAAALILVPTPRFVARYCERGFSRLMVLPHLVAPRRTPDTESLSLEGRGVPDKLEIVFTGMIYEAHRQATEAFVRAVRGMPDVCLRFATPAKADYLDGVSIGPVSRGECLAMQEAADVLFLPLGIDSPYPLEVQSCLPSKLLDYFAAGKPILAVVPPGSYVAELVEGADAGLVVTTVDAAAIQSAVERLRDPALRRRLGGNALRACAQFAPGMHAGRLMRALERCVTAGHVPGASAGAWERRSRFATFAGDRP